MNRESVTSDTATGRKVTESNIPSTALAPSAWGTAGRKLRAARLGENPDPLEAAGLLVAFACDRAPLREARTGRVDLAAGTVAVYEREAKRFARWAAAGGVNLLRVTSDDLRRYATERLAAGELAATVSRAVTLARMLSRAFRWAGLDVTIPETPRIKDPVKAEDKRRPAPWADFSRAASSAAASSLLSCDPSALRLAAAVLLLGTSGLRASEAVGLRWADLETDRGVIRVRGKGAKERLAPLTAGTLAILAAMRPENGSGPILAGPGGRPLSRQRLWTVVRKWEKENGLPSGLHVLRHQAAERLAGSADLRAVRDFLGHANASTTERYAKRHEADDLRGRVLEALRVER